MNPIHDGTSRKIADRDTAMALSGGHHYHNPKRIAQQHWEICPPVRRVPVGNTDYSGHKFGRFTVVGLHHGHRSDGRALWIVRCSCGNFETRISKSILNPKNFGDRCQKCRQLAYERRNYEWCSNGADLDVRKL